MPFTLAFEDDLIRVTLSGELTGQDLVDMAAAADEAERGRYPVPPRITDMTGVTDLKVSYPDVRKLAERRRSLRFPNAFRSAIVVGSASQRGIARTFQTLNDNPKITISIFTDEDEALKWVRGQG